MFGLQFFNPLFCCFAKLFFRIRGRFEYLPCMRNSSCSFSRITETFQASSSWCVNVHMSYQVLWLDNFHHCFRFANFIILQHQKTFCVNDLCTQFLLHVFITDSETLQCSVLCPVDMHVIQFFCVFFFIKYFHIMNKVSQSHLDLLTVYTVCAQLLFLHLLQMCS